MRLLQLNKLQITMGDVKFCFAKTFVYDQNLRLKSDYYQTLVLAKVNLFQCAAALRIKTSLAVA